VTLHTAFTVQTTLWMVMELLERGSILSLMRTPGAVVPPATGLDEATAAHVLRSAVEGAAYLHSRGLVHRDIKAANILVGADGSVKLADFGVSGVIDRLAESRNRKVETFVGTPCWMAPEVVEQVNGYDTKADIWSIGITAYEMITGSAPLAKYPPLKVMMLIIQSPPPRLERVEGGPAYSSALRKFIEACLQKAPEDRPTAAKLLEHPFFKGVKRTNQFLVEKLFPRLEEGGG
jgi:serine/threonine-protein kinase OSR1/STK39